MNIWVAFPSANIDRANQASALWRARGYRVAILTDSNATPDCDLLICGPRPYRGYWGSCNRLCSILTSRATAPGGIVADIVVLAADDIEPDQTREAREIGEEFKLHFPDLFGVMQPSGDPQGKDQHGIPAAARICGTPWLGREWIRRAYGGRGATNDRYFHFYGDEELYLVAERLKVLWMRPDVTQFHRHWSWGWNPITRYQEQNQKTWHEDQDLFMIERSAGFPGSEPLEA